MVKINLDVCCTHNDLDKNIKCDIIESDDNFLSYRCPVCKKEFILIYSLEDK